MTKKSARQKQEEQEARERRSHEAGKKDSEIGFGGTVLDMGEEDAEGVGRGK